jgi:transcriptional regulator with XRE-family HTH domain
MKVHKRFAKWVAWRGTSQSQIASDLGCTQAFVSLLASGKKSIAKLPMAHAVERLSADWPDGPIRTEEWDATTPAARRYESSGATGGER